MTTSGRQSRPDGQPENPTGPSALSHGPARPARHSPAVRDRPDNAAKEALWEAFTARRAARVPLRWNVNVRIVLLDPLLNPEGWTFEQYLHDPAVTIAAQIRFQEYAATQLSRVSDRTDSLPDAWRVSPDVQNAYDPAYFGGHVHAPPGQVPAVESFLTLDDVDGFLARDFASRPLEAPFIRERLAFRAELVKAAAPVRHLGRPVHVAPFMLGFDGPVTAAAAIFGSDFFALLGEDPARAQAVLAHITRGVLARNAALRRLAGEPERATGGAWFADDSIQLISAAMYEELVLPLHALYLDACSTSRVSERGRSCHLCGDATRHFRVIRDRLGVDAFDTGFPVDHGALRRELGPDVLISGGPHVGLLRNGTPDACYREAERILQSGIKEGGRFILQEGNNLPPSCPLENLAAVYEACRECGRLA